MSQLCVRCRCGHHVVGRELLRIEPYERASGEEAIYVKYRCRRCKMLGEAFVSRDEWNPQILDTPRDEMSYSERDRFVGEKEISSSDVISFHRTLQKATTLSDLSRPDSRRKDKKGDKTRSKDRGDKPSGEAPSQAGRPGP